MSIRIGTSGWTYPHWKESFFPSELTSSDRLSYYAAYFSTVEVNTTFYGLPRLSTVRAWGCAVPAHFRFAFKISRYITHRLRLNDARQSVRRFFQSIAPLHAKTCAVLVQLPPRWDFNASRLRDFIKILPRDYSYAFEFRDPSWFCPECYEILSKAKIALCVYDLKGFQSPEILTSDFVYIRLHGPTIRAYRGSYPPKTLQEWKNKIDSWHLERKAVFVYFDNDEKGYAAHNALHLMELLGVQVGGSAI